MRTDETPLRAVVFFFHELNDITYSSHDWDDGVQRWVRTNERVADDERLGGNHALAPDAGWHHGGLTHVTFDLPPTLGYVVHAGGRHSTL